MKKYLLLFFMALSSVVFAQQKSFEGTIDYEVSVTSKVDYLNENDIRAIIFEPVATRMRYIQNWQKKR